jgi:hypothetical protein
MDLENTVIKGDVKRADLGLKIGSVFAFSLLLSSTVLIIKGHDWAGVALMGMDLSGVIGAFVYGTYSRRKEREAKEEIRRGDKSARKALPR